MLLILIPLAIWSYFWKIVCLWFTAKNNEKEWFVVFALVSLAGILELYYLRSRKCWPFKNLGMSEETEKNEPPPQDVGQLWKWVFHEDNLFSNRGNLLLVAESMIFTAFAIVLANSRATVAPWFLGMVAIFGVFLSLVWLRVMSIQKSTVTQLKDRLKKADKLYGEICGIRKHDVGIHQLLGYLVPAAILVVWLALLILIVYWH